MFPMCINWPLFTRRRLRQHNTSSMATSAPGFACTFLFLELNGWILIADPLEAAKKTLNLADKKLTAENYGEWLKANSTRLRQDRQRNCGRQK